MSANVGAAAPESGTLAALICKEWPSLEGSRVSELLGDDDKLTAYVAGKTKHTHALVAAQLVELRNLANGRLATGELSLAAMLSRLETRAEEALKMVKTDLAQNAKEAVEKNVWMSLGIAALLGIIVGFLFRGGGRDR